MTELTKERVEELRKYIEDAFGEWGQDRPIVARVKADLLAALSDYSALKAFKDNLMKDGHANLVRVATHRDALKVENEGLRGEVERWKDEWHGMRDAGLACKGQAEKAEAALAKQAPLIEAVMRAILYDSEVPGSSALEFSETDEKTIYRAALALREEKGK